MCSIFSTYSENSDYFRQEFRTLFSGKFLVTFAKFLGVQNPCIFSVQFRSPKVQKVRNTGKTESPKFFPKRMALAEAVSLFDKWLIWKERKEGRKKDMYVFKDCFVLICKNILMNWAINMKGSFQTNWTSVLVLKSQHFYRSPEKVKFVSCLLLSRQ